MLEIVFRFLVVILPWFIAAVLHSSSCNVVMHQGLNKQVNGLAMLISTRWAFIVDGCMRYASCIPYSLVNKPSNKKVVKQFALQDRVKQQGMGKEMFV